MSLLGVCAHCGAWTGHDLLCKTNLPIGGRGKPSGAPLYRKDEEDEAGD